MSDRNLTELEWKKFAKGRNLKDAALVKAIADLERAARTGPDAQLAALADIEKQADSLRKSAKGDKELAGYMDGLDKALDKQRKLSEFEAKKAAKAPSEDQEEETPALLTTKMVPLLRQIKKGEQMPVLLASAGKNVALMLSRRAISPSKRKLLSDYLDGGTAKFFSGLCLFEDNAYTFVLKTQAAGMAKKLKAALLAQVELRLRVRVRGEDPNDVDEELGDADDGDEAPGAGVASGRATAGAGAAPGAVAGPARAADAATPGPGIPKPGSEDAQARYEARSAQLTPWALAALKAQQGDASKIRAVAEFAREKGESGNYKAALAALDSLEKLLPTAAPAATAEPKPVSQVKLQQARLAWDAARQKIQADIATLQKEILAKARGEPDFADIAQVIKGFETLKSRFDKRLIDKLDEALNAGPEQRPALHREAVAMIDRYQDQVASEPLLRDLDDNPFVQLSVQATLNRTLDYLAQQLK